MKRIKLVSLSLLLMSVLMSPAMGYTADDNLLWNATLYAKGQEIDGMSEYEVTIGIGIEGQALPSPPSAPMYSTKMDLFPKSGGERLSTEIHPKNSQKKYTWTLSVDPHGNIMPPAIRTSTISWNSEDFVASFCMLRQGFNNKEGKIVVENMNTLSSFSVEGGPKEQFFTIECSY